MIVFIRQTVNNHLGGSTRAQIRHDIIKDLNLNIKSFDFNHPNVNACAQCLSNVFLDNYLYLNRG
jgi:hypothetical protein